MTWYLWAALAVFVFAPYVGIVAYIVVMTFKPFRDRGELGLFPWWVRAVVISLLPFGALADIIVNWFVVSFTFRDPPREGYLTKRLQRYRELPDGDRRKRRAIKNWSWLNLLDEDHW